MSEASSSKFQGNTEKTDMCGWRYETTESINDNYKILKKYFLVAGNSL